MWVETRKRFRTMRDGEGRQICWYERDMIVAVGPYRRTDSRAEEEMWQRGKTMGTKK